MTLAAALASVVAAFGALAAVFYARQTVKEARLARSEDERDRALRRVERIGELLSEVASGAEHGNWFLLWNSQKLLTITLAAVGLDTRRRLPKSSEVAATRIGSANFSQGLEMARAAQEEVRDLLDEIAGSAVLEMRDG